MIPSNPRTAFVVGTLVGLLVVPTVVRVVKAKASAVGR